MRIVAQRHVEGQAPGEPAGEALAHGVGLSGHGEGAAAGLGQIAGQGQQIDDRDDVVLSVHMLVVADAPHDDDAAIAAGLFALAAGQPLAGGVGEHAGDPADECGRDVVIGPAHAVLHLFRAVPLEHAVHVFLPAGGVLLEERPVDHVVVLLQEDMGDGVEEADVAVQDRDVDGVFGIDILVAGHRSRAARIDDHRRDVLLFLVIGGAPENDRVRFAGIVAEVHDHVGQFDVRAHAGCSRCPT